VFFYRTAAMQAMQGGLRHERNVRPSVKRMNFEKRKKPMPTFLYHNKDQYIYTVSQKKTSPTFLAITRESIDDFYNIWQKCY